MYNFMLGGTLFPVSPSSMTLNVNNKNETVTLISEGEVNILKKPGLSDITFEILLPNKRYPFANYENGFVPSTYYLERLEKIKTDMLPVSFIVNRFFPNGELMYDTNMMVSLEEYEILEDAEELGFDVRVSITLKQYVDYGTKKLITQQSATATSNKKVTVEKSRSTATKQTPNTYKVKSGDTLYGIAKKFLGDGNKFSELVRINKISNPSLINEGQIIKLK